MGLGSVKFLTSDLSALRSHLHRHEDVQNGSDHLTLSDPWGKRLTVQSLE